MCLSRRFVAGICFASFLNAAPVQRSSAKRQTATHSKKAPATGTTAAALVRSLSLHDRIAQMIMVRGYGDYPRTDNAEYKTLLHWIEDDHVGGMIVANRVIGGSVINAQPFEMVTFLNHLQKLSKMPLLIGSDFEHGAAMRVAGTAKFPYWMSFGATNDPALARELGRATAQEARALGVQWIFAPDADVNNNPDNPIINIRSYGEDPNAVATGVGAYIDGAHSDPLNYVLVSAKHFPGHGDTAEDSHMQLPKSDQPKERLEAVEFVPFRAAIEHNADSIMTAHIALPSVEPESIPSTVSRKVLTGVLREELGFKGLIVTDAMDMQGLAALYTPGEAAVRTVEAGTDVLLMPANPEACIRAIQQAVAKGRISQKRIDQSATKIIAAKQLTGLFRSRFVSADGLTDFLADPKLEHLAQNVADRSLTLVKDDKHLIPMPQTPDSCLVVLTEGLYSQRGQVMVNYIQRKNAALRVYLVNSAFPDSLLTAFSTDAASCKQIYVATFVTVAAYRGGVGLQGGLDKFMNGLVHGPAPVAMISLGNPYLLRNYPDVSSYLATFSTTTTSELAAAKALLGEIPISGHLPVSIPGLAKIGDGMSVAGK